MTNIDEAPPARRSRVATGSQGNWISPLRTGSVQSIDVTSAHKVLSDYEADFRRGGKVFDGPMWTPSQSHPITHTGGQALKATIRFNDSSAADGTSVKVAGQIRGGSRSRLRRIAFAGTGSVSNGIVTAQVESTAPLPTGIYKEQVQIDWGIDRAQGLVPVGTTGLHPVYVTLGVPVSEVDPKETELAESESRKLPGVTLKRLEKAFELVDIAKASDSLAPHALAARLMNTFPGFDLTQGSHFFNDSGGAWVVEIGDGVECQAIVRLIKNVLDIVGAPGFRSIVCLYADPDNPLIPIELPWGGKPTEKDLPLKKQMKLVDFEGERRGWGVALITEMPEVTDKGAFNREYGRCWKPGLVSAATNRAFILREKPNSYEACLRMTVDGETRYYGGGMPGGVFSSARDVLPAAFWGMVWTMVVPNPDKTPHKFYRNPAEVFRLMEIHYIYRQGKEDCCW
jgi:hypothetical protein